MPVPKPCNYGQQMDLKDLITTLKSSNDSTVSRSCRRISVDSRKVQPGDIFVAVRGGQFDGHEFIGQAVEAGAAIIVSERSVKHCDSVERVPVRNSAEALGQIVRAAYGLDEMALTQLGVTGTNGKTTVAYVTRAILKGAKIPCGLLSTIEYDLGDEIIAPTHTTPDALRLAESLCRMKSNGLSAMVMECSSHGLHQRRTELMDFTAAALTNVSGDHFDYHGNEQNYLMAKSLLFRSLNRDGIAVLNAHDPASQTMAKVTQAKVWQYGIDTDTEIVGEIESLSVEGSEWKLSLAGGSVSIQSRLIGRYNVLNCLAAAGLAHAAGASLGDIAEGLRDFCGVPGRVERIECGQSFTVLVDYAHTDDALRCTLASLRELHGGRIILVFGCGGDRDRLKRPRMAGVAERFADQIFLTNDNPRCESPDRIMREITAGFTAEGMRKVTRQLDRRGAIEAACRAAGRGDLVLIAGKGHERTQEIDGEKTPFDDRLVVRQILSRSMEQVSKRTITPTHAH